ncbi:MAG: 4-carboxy-4-hydroxy-2-oxoadipate aldolase/oxaloacetate decarboxylase [Rhodocyclaceae bacterium]|nr:4-carboxy-4-hydroxy-2-oxoadipate aldolase/oxaloacetate decarboxylase [Rhodocyclaceae bacterium]
MTIPMNTLGIVRRNIARADKAAVDKLSKFGVATIHEAMGRVGLMTPAMRPIYAGAHLCGTAVTVLLHPGDNWMMHVAAEQLQQGDVVVAALSAECTDGFFGDLLATSFRARGATGPHHRCRRARCEGPHRDGFPGVEQVHQRQGHHQGHTRPRWNIPVVCAGALVNPGDAVVADDDGVVVVPAAIAQQVADAAEARENNEAGKRKRLAAGELGLDMYSMREALAKAGLKYED